MAEKEDIYQLFHKFIHHQCTDEELQQIQEILRQGKYTDVWQELIEEDALDSILQQQNMPVPSSAKIYHRINSTIDQELETPRKQTLSKAPQGRTRWLGWAAAVALLCIALGGFLLTKYDYFQSSEIVYQQDSTGVGQRKGLRLADGTEVWLNNTSSIRFPEQFSDTLREVFLEGEALFEVAKDTDRPFIVHGGEVAVKVLGTVFNVNAYADNTHTTVSVASGRVAVGRKDRQEEMHVLLPDQQLVYDKDGQTFTKQSVAIADALAWKEGVLVFHDQTLEEIMRVLERRYGLTVDFADEALKHKRVTLKKKGDQMQSVLKILQYVADIHYQYEANGKVTITH